MDSGKRFFLCKEEVSSYSYSYRMYKEVHFGLNNYKFKGDRS